MKTYGRRIKRSKNLYKRKKTKLRMAVEIIITVVIAAGLGVVGYSAGKPLIEFLSNSEKPSDISADTDTPEETDSESVLAESSSAPETTEPAQTTTEIIAEENGRIAFTPNTALKNASSLSAYVLQLKADGYNISVIELKDISGNLWYKTNLSDLKDKNFVKGGLSLSQIKAIFDNAGIKPVVKINTLQDPAAPNNFADIGYRFADGSSNWLDAAADNGGKMWANPFLDGTKKYISDIAGEIASADFGEIVLAGLMFPKMTSYDASILPPQVSNINNRYTALVDLYKACAVKSGNTKISVEINVKDVAESYAGFLKTAEILRGKSELSEASVVLYMNRSEIGEELQTGATSSVSLPSDASALVTALYKQAARNAGQLKIVPSISADDFSKSELKAVIEAFEKMGYAEYIVK